MTLPIVAYGSPILRKTAADITPEYAGLQKLIEDMWETMYYSNGVGLAAPQVNKDIRLFVVDSAQIFEHQDKDEKGYQKSVYQCACGCPGWRTLGIQ